jgi:protein O-mannosyl-transferase
VGWFDQCPRRPARSPRARSARWELLIAFCLAALTAVGFAPACSNGFVNLDDETYVVNNPHVRGGLTGKDVAWAFETFYASNWHPLTWLSLQLDATIWKTPEGALDPAGFHITSVLLHVFNAVLVFLVFNRLTGQPGPSAILAAFFAVHPLRVESVAWVAERKDVLSSFFGLLAVLAYTGYAAAPSIRRYVVVAIFFALSLLAKPMWVTLPWLLLLLDWWPLGRVPAATDGVKDPGFRSGWWPLLREKLPLFLIAALSCLVTWLAQKVAVSSLEHVPLGSRVANALVSYAAYLAQTFWPVDLAPFYPLPLEGRNFGPVVASGVFLVAVSALVASQWKARPYLAAGWLWFLGTLVPVVGLVQVGSQARADRYTYLPLIGVDLMVVWGLDELAGRLRLRKPALVAAGVVVAALTLFCQAQVRLWHDEFSLWEHTLHATGDNWMAQYSLGVANERAGNMDKALERYQEAMRLNEKNAPLRARTGTLLHTLRDYGRARFYYEEALRLDPDFAQAHANLGALLRTLGEPGAALQHLEEAVRLEPNERETAPAYFNLGAILEARGDRENAREAYRNAVRLDPNSRSYRGSLNRLQGKS